MREAPAVMVFAIPNNNTSISDLNVPRFVKRRNLAAQLDVQSVQGDWQFDDVGILRLIRSRFTAAVKLRFFLKLSHVMPSSARSHVCALVANDYNCGPLVALEAHFGFRFQQRA